MTPADRNIDWPVSRTFAAYFDVEPYPALSGGDRTPLEGRMLADLLEGLVQQVRALREEQSGQREQVRALTEWKNEMVKRMAAKRPVPAKPGTARTIAKGEDARPKTAWEITDGNPT